MASPERPAPLVGGGGGGGRQGGKPDIPISREDALRTYRYLRLAMVLLVLLLFISVGWEVKSAGDWCLEGSISAYYYTPARAVFVASLCGIGTCLIAYKGSTDIEDVLLNISGFLAFVVAFVPTEPDEVCNGSNVPTLDEQSAAISNNLVALLSVSVLVVVVAYVTEVTSDRKQLRRIGLEVQVAVVVAAASAVILGGGLLTPFDISRHDVAAITLFVSILAVVGVNIWQPASATVVPATTNYRRMYGAVGGAMILSSLGIVGARLLFDGFVEWVFWLEASLIILFASFWFIQTLELWTEGARKRV